MGWRITKCEVLVEQGDQPVQEITTSTSLPRSPYKVSYILPLIAKMIAETPMASNKVLCQVLEPYGRAYCFTDAIIQKARTEARKLIFGDADDNVAYTRFVKENLEKAGHHVELSFTTRKEMMNNLDKIILAEEAQRRKDANIDGILLENRKAFVLQWRKKHDSIIMERLGTPADQDHLNFLNGIFFAPSFAKATVPHLQKVFMADACHLNFGKYTLFSCYGVTANSNASPAAFAIIFGNESTSKYNKDKHFINMSNKDINYLNSIDDESQYPAARCAMGVSVYMYSHSSSGTAESMNKANKEMRARTAVDLLNACILLIKLEVNRYYKTKKEVWAAERL